MSQVITRPGEEGSTEPYDEQLHGSADFMMRERLRAIVRELEIYAAGTRKVETSVYDATRYQSLRLAAREAAVELHRAIDRWSTTVS